MVRFSKPSITELEHTYVTEAIKGNICGDGHFTKKASELFREATGVSDIILTTSCTHALELSALLCGIQPGDEIILPSYTFPSTANAFLLHGAKIVFCDIREDTLNLDETLIPELITRNTKAIVPVHYAGVSCEMDKINEFANEHGLMVVEDAAQAVGSTYKSLPCGALSDIGCFSFHETKNYSMGEGGGIVIRDEALRKRAEIIREKGTDRSRFFRGEVDKYTWQQMGSSYLPSDILAALLCAQLYRFEEIMQSRINVWNAYHKAFAALEENGWRRPVIPDNCAHNAHMYYLLAPSAAARAQFISEIKERGVQCVSHYEPLHASPMGRKMGYIPEELPLTLDFAARLVRLPMWAGMGEETVSQVILLVKESTMLC